MRLGIQRFGILAVGVLSSLALFGPALAQDGRRVAFQLPQQPDFSTVSPDQRGGERRVRLRAGPDDTRHADRIAFAGDTVESRLRDLGVRDGARFGDRGRLYLFAADGSRAVGYNLTRGEDGWSRQGLSVDDGAFMGDAQAGIAWRKGDFQTSFGYVQRDMPRENRLGRNLDEGIVALHLSFVPSR
jgi:hypothetical protein